MTMRTLHLVFAGLFSLGVPSSGNEESPRQSVLSACQGANVTFPWTFASHPLAGNAEKIESSTPSERSQTLEWVIGDGSGDRSRRISLGTYSSAEGLFSAGSPVYVQRVALSADWSGMTLSQLTTQDSATYSLLVLDGHGVTTRVLHQLLLTVDGLASSDGDLHVQMGDRAMWNSNTNQWMITLTCGLFSFHDPPSFDVTWTTPTGAALQSSDYSQGQFHLHLFPPVPGGRYVCRVPQQLFTNACVSAGGGSQGDGKLESSVWVDEVFTRLLILEADQKTLAAENRELKENQTTRCEEEMRILKEEVDRQRGKINLLGTTIAFMTKMNESLRLGAYQRIKPQLVFYNAGDAYSSATGVFTAPIAGTYHFFLKTEASRRENRPVTLRMMTQGRRLLYLFAEASKIFLTPSGSVVVHVRQGQQVWVDTDWKDTNWVTGWTTFGGFLVRPDVGDIQSFDWD